MSECYHYMADPVASWRWSCHLRLQSESTAASPVRGKGKEALGVGAEHPERDGKLVRNDGGWRGGGK